ncbi:MAG: hypothetical protein M2R45_05292 [Verrucomicrobia subdivision 3 bacterium]|nr:hypothetical protein [Limisphaerales bacterium]MCS1417829.1 hypothetical protein [Limisphaerales bacterium]
MMEIDNKRSRVPLVLSLAGLCGTLAAQTEELEWERLPEEVVSELTEKYQVIVDRNPFSLQPLPPPPKTEEKPEKEPVSLKELDLMLAGVSGRGGEMRVWLAMTLPPSQPEQDTVRRFFPFREGEEQHGITVKSIQTNGDVDIEYDGTPVALTLPTHGNKKEVKPKGQPKNNIRTARTAPVPNRAVITRSGNTTIYRHTSAANGLRTASARSGGRTVPAGRSATATRTIPTHPGRTQPKQQLSREEQITILEAQRALSKKEGRPFPPLPPFWR